MLAASAVTLNRRSFIDAKILHFAYFYLLWLLIALAVRAALKPGESFAELPLDYVKALVEPFGMLWFIHILPAMYLILRLSAARWLWPAVAVSMALHFWASLNLTGNGGAMGAHMTGSTFADSMALYLISCWVMHCVITSTTGQVSQRASRVSPFWLSPHGSSCTQPP